MTYNKWLIFTRSQTTILKATENWLFLAFLWLDKNSQRWLYSYKKNITYFNWKILKRSHTTVCFLGSIVVSIPACHAGDRGSIPRRGEIRSLLLFLAILNNRKWLNLSEKFKKRVQTTICFLGSIVVSIPACHAGDRGSIPRRGEIRSLLLFLAILNNRKLLNLSEKFKKEFRQPSVSSVV